MKSMCSKDFFLNINLSQKQTIAIKIIAIYITYNYILIDNTVIFL